MIQQLKSRNRVTYPSDVAKGHGHTAGEQRFRRSGQPRRLVNHPGQLLLDGFLHQRKLLVLPIDLTNVQRFARVRVQELGRMVVARQHGQFVVGLLHEVGVRETHYRVQTLRQVVRVLADYALRRVRVQHYDQQAGVVVFWEFKWDLLKDIVKVLENLTVHRCNPCCIQKGR